MNEHIKQPLPTGTDSFKEIRADNYYYIDKTMMIADFLQLRNKVTLITRPRRFGKTLNMTMLREFFDIEQKSAELFKGLAIMETEYASELNTKPVIYLTFKSCSGATIDDLKDGLAHQMMQEYIRFGKVFKDKVDEDDIDYFVFYQTYEALKKVLTPRPRDKKDESQVDTGLFKKSLTTLLQTVTHYYNKPTLLLIDEYDQPLLNAHESGFREQFSKEIYADFFGDALKGNEALGLSMLTGIQRVAKESIFSKLNNPVVYTVVDEIYASYFGLTETETKKALEDNGLTLSDDVKRYYDGYTFGGIDVYNPWSILNYITKMRLESYWVNTSTNLLIRQLILKQNQRFYDDFETLITEGQVSVTCNLVASFMEINSVATLWGLLVNAGYLTISSQKSEIRYVVRIPNDEVKKEFSSIVELYTYQEDEGDLQAMFGALIDSDMDEFLKIYRTLIVRYVSFHDTAIHENVEPENSYHMLFLGMCMSMLGMYKPRSNREDGDGRSDIIMASLEPHRRPHIIVEFKRLKEAGDLKKEAGIALNQIFTNRYYSDLKGETLCIGIAHFGKKAELSHREIEVNEYGEVK